jgi:hypothetical protein
LGVFTTLFSGCVVVEEHHPRRAPAVVETVPVPPPSVEVVVIRQAPPPVRVEVVVERERPTPRHVWVAGYWVWRANRHEWVAGHWELPPREHAVWVEPRWEPRNGGHVFIAGMWKDGPAVSVSVKEVIVRTAPPALRKEVIVERPSPRHVWVAGYWVWHSNKHDWVAGHWEVPPRGKTAWVEARWDRRGDSFVFIEGFWR